MKQAKKLAAVLLSLVLVLALAVPASAAGNYTITITNDQAGHTYEAYQIFAGDVSDDTQQGGNVEGPILSNITWGKNIENTTGLIQALIDSDIAAFDGLNAATSTAATVAEALEVAADAAAFANLVEPFLTGDPATSGAYNAEAHTYTITGLDAGYYLVKDQDESLNGAAATATEYIVQVLGNVQMEPKDSDVPTVEKKVFDQEYAQIDAEGVYGTGYNDVADWKIGDSVPFKLIGSIPDMSAYDTYEYIFTDTLSNGLTLQEGTIDVYIAVDKNDEVGEYTPLTAGKDYTLNVQNVGANGGGSFSIAFDDLKTAPHMDQGNRQYVIVTYDATLNANAEIGLDGNPNSVDLQFSNDPNGDGLGRTTEDTVIVFTYELDGTKVDGENEDTKLEGAEFVLFNGGHTRVAHIENGKLVGWVALPGGYDSDTYQQIPYETWETFNRTTNVIMTSAAEGAFGVSGLDDGTYHLMEIKAPNGYNLLEGDVQLVIEATTVNGQTWNGVANTALTALTINVANEGAVNGKTDTGAVNVTVRNNQGATLPETGGMGTTLFYIIGGLLVVGAGILLVVRIRMRSHNE